MGSLGFGEWSNENGLHTFSYRLLSYFLLNDCTSNKRIDIPASTWSDLNKLQSPLAHEIANGLQFDAATPQVQPSNDQGQGTWKFGISPEVKPGTYYLVILTDWDGTYANWTWFYFTVKANG